MRLLPYGERAVLAEVDDPSLVLALRDAVLGTEGVLDAVPGARTLLVEFDPTATSAPQLGVLLAAVRTRPPAPGADTRIELSVTYDGPDLGAVAAECGMSPAEVIRRHSAALYTVAFCGFAPGFAYLTGLDPALHVARLDTPRTSVPAGAVGIAGEFAGVYPRSSPGGWRLLGTTATRLWDSSHTPPALLSPGTAVRFAPA